MLARSPWPVYILPNRFFNAENTTHDDGVLFRIAQLRQSQY
jgi:hypothetical protein